MINKNTGCLVLMGLLFFMAGCEHINPSCSFEPEQKAGLFSGKKGYFEIMPKGPKSQKDFDDAPGILGSLDILGSTD